MRMACIRINLIYFEFPSFLTNLEVFKTRSRHFSENQKGAKSKKEKTISLTFMRSIKKNCHFCYQCFKKVTVLCK